MVRAAWRCCGTDLSVTVHHLFDAVERTHPAGDGYHLRAIGACLPAVAALIRDGKLPLDRRGRITDASLQKRAEGTARALRHRHAYADALAHQLAALGGQADLWRRSPH